MAAISRTFASQLVNRSYVNVPASAGALKKAFSISSSSRDEESQAPAAHYASTKDRSSAGPLNRSFVNGKKHSPFSSNAGRAKTEPFESNFERFFDIFFLFGVKCNSCSHYQLPNSPSAYQHNHRSRLLQVQEDWRLRI